MGWERRRRGGRYYTRSKKVNGRVVREYLGCGDVAQLAAQTDALAREWRQLQALELRDQKAELDALDAGVRDVLAPSDLAARAALLAAGFHQHKRGEWRRNVPKPTTSAAEATVPRTGAEIKAVFSRAELGDESALPALRQLLKNPRMVELLGGDLAREAQLTRIATCSGENLLAREALTRKLQMLRDEQAGPSPTPLERLLVERVVACWLHLYMMEANHAAKHSINLKLGIYYQQCFDRAQRRYLSAIKTLALVRKLALPVLVAPVNGAQQVNARNGDARQGGEARHRSGTPRARRRRTPESGRHTGRRGTAPAHRGRGPAARPG
jgi:hypothetical protein